MSLLVPDRLTMSDKVRRLSSRLRDPQWRRYGGTLLAGKLMGVGLVMCVMLAVAIFPSLFSHTAHAQQAAATTSAPAAAYPAIASDPTAIINPVNTAWTLVAGFLVFGMQAGFTMLEAGFCRSRETVNVLVECVFDTCLCGFLFYAFGYAFMFGQGNGLIGWHDPNDALGVTNSWFFLQNIPATYAGTGVATLAHWIFQFAFADCASTICSGTMIGRTAFAGDILYSVCVSGFIYPIIGHWVWGPDGMLYTMGGQNTPANPEAFTHLFPSVGYYFHDFAGSTVVHSIGGFIALAGGVVLGPRLGRKFKRDGGGPMPPHDLVMGVIGGFILWFGWYGFNPGSTLSAMDFVGTGRIAANTTLAASTAGITAIYFMYFRTKKWDAGAITNGFLAGLVAITCPCYWVSPTGACILGAVAGIVVILAADVLEFLRIDDPIGAVPVHAICGVWGTLSLGLFACGDYNLGGSGALAQAIRPVGAAIDPTAYATGLFYHGGTGLLTAQTIGVVVVDVSTFVIALIVMYAVHMMGLLRVTAHGELEGLDIHEHGMPAYPDYVYAPSASPTGLPAENVNGGVISTVTTSVM